MHGTIVMGKGRLVPRHPWNSAPPESQGYRLTVRQAKRPQIEAIARGKFYDLIDLSEQFQAIGYEFVKMERVDGCVKEKTAPEGAA